MKYEEVVRYIEDIPKFTKKHTLLHTREFMRRLGNPCQGRKVLHVAGTNGKGSVCAYMQAILLFEGKRVGFFTSPHLVKLNERIRINGKDIDDDTFCRIFAKVRQVAEELEKEGLEHPSYFEFLYGMGMLAFEENDAEYIVLETGLGGRLDATNSFEHPFLSVITSIGLDHTEILGDTIEKIAGEKAGIIKKGTPVVIGEATEETRPVFAGKAEEMHAPIVFAEDDNRILKAENSDNGLLYETREYGCLQGELGGYYQIKNTNTILHALSQLIALEYAIKEENIRHGFARVNELTGLMGRWQKLSDHPLLICDTGHNTGGITYITQQIKSIVYDHLHIVIGMVNDKDIRGVLNLLPQDATYYFTKASVKRALPEEELKRTAREFGLHGNTYPTVTEAVRAAQEKSLPKDFIFVGGSSFIVADLLANRNALDLD